MRGRAYLVRHRVFVTGDYLPFDLEPGYSVFVKEVFALRNEVRIHMEGHPTGVCSAVVPAASLGAL